MSHAAGVQEGEILQVRREGSVAVMTMNYPQRRNAFNDKNGFQPEKVPPRTDRGDARCQRPAAGSAAHGACCRHRVVSRHHDTAELAGHLLEDVPERGAAPG